MCQTLVSATVKQQSISLKYVVNVNGLHFSESQKFHNGFSIHAQIHMLILM